MTELKDKIEEVTKDIKDIFTLDFTFTETTEVPSIEDKDLTYERGAAKQGMSIETCVLFVDIRDSVKINKNHYTKTKGKMYTAFTKAVLKLACYHGGYIRNIIGDRVMVVFPSDNCFTNAVDCAISINHIAAVINETFKGESFKCGIGIDYGELKAIKVGWKVNGQENSENKGLVWVGYPANYASRLTDYANKSVQREYWHIEGYMKTFDNLFLRPSIFPVASLLHETSKQVDYSIEEFPTKLFISGGQLHVHGFDSISKCEKQQKPWLFQPILISEKVFVGFKKKNPNRNSIIKGLWKIQNWSIKDIEFLVYGADLHWIF